ncbi:MAG: MlaD family protein [Candidatus Competibacteraceae bacterium]
MQSKVNYILVGLFVLMLGAALLAGMFWLTVGSERKVYDRYRVYFRESVSGLNPKATVKYQGVAVGQVESIRLDTSNPNQVDVVLNIERGTPIRQDTIATLSTQGLTGVASVELSVGSGQMPPLEAQPDQDLPVIQAGPSLVARLDTAFKNMLTNVDKLSGRLEWLLSDENQTALTEILRNLSVVTGAVADRAGSIRQILTHVEQLTSTLAGRSERLGKALDRLAATLEDTSNLSSQAQATLSDFRSGAQAVRKMADNFSQTSQTLDDLAKDGRQELRRLGQSTVPELNALLAQINDLAAVLQRLAELLEQNPRVLLLGKPSGRPGPGEQ